MHSRIVLDKLRYKGYSRVSGRIADSNMALAVADRRGVLALGCCILTCIMSAMMIDGLLDEVYGVSFVPIYILWVSAFVEHLAVSSKYQVVLETSNIRASGHRFSARWWGGIFNAALWLVIIILFQLYLYDVDTVPTQSFIYLVTLWCSLSIMALFVDWEICEPFSLKNTAAYVTDIPSTPVDFGSFMDDRRDAGIEYEDEGSAGKGSSFMNDDQDNDDTLFKEQEGTVRRMSVSDSQRNSINSSPIRDDEVVDMINDLEEMGEELGVMTRAIQNAPVVESTVHIPSSSQSHSTAVPIP